MALANFDGGSRPQMVTAQSIEAEVALLPLLSHRLDIHRLAIIKPDVLIETTQAGRGNWLFTSQPRRLTRRQRPRRRGRQWTSTSNR